MKVIKVKVAIESPDKRKDTEIGASFQSLLYHFWSKSERNEKSNANDEVILHLTYNSKKVFEER